MDSYGIRIDCIGKLVPRFVSQPAIYGNVPINSLGKSLAVTTAERPYHAAWANNREDYEASISLVEVDGLYLPRYRPIRELVLSGDAV